MLTSSYLRTVSKYLISCSSQIKKIEVLVNSLRKSDLMISYASSFLGKDFFLRSDSTFLDVFVSMSINLLQVSVLT